MNPITRYPIIDILRVIAIILMIIFHFAWDLNAFRYVKISFTKEPFWYWLPRFIVFLFLICMGMSMKLSYANGVDKRKVFKRFSKIGFFALIITGYTYFAFPKNWIYFGTLHCIAICSVICLPFLNTIWFNLLCGISLPALFFIFKIKPVPWSKSLGIVSMDYIPLHPWFGVVLLGIAMTHFKIHEIGKDLKIPKWVSWSSRNSLEIYLIHQGVLYGLVAGYYHFAK